MHSSMRDDAEPIVFLNPRGFIRVEHRQNTIIAESIEQIDHDRYRIVLTETHPPLFIKRAELRDSQ